MNSSYSDASNNSRSTASSILSERTLSKYDQERPQAYSNQLVHIDRPLHFQRIHGHHLLAGSIDVDAARISSEKELTHRPKYEVPLTPHDVYASDAIPSTPADFAQLFSAGRRLLIHHDDATSDGNMNLRVDTVAFGSDGRSQKLILFHLRMHDLKDRHFSLSRYCRDSKREICSSSRKYAPAPQPSRGRAKIQQSLGHASQPLRIHHDASMITRDCSARHDPDYDSSEDELHSCSLAGVASSNSPSSSTNLIQLEFSNDAHIIVGRKGTKSSKRYEYELGGTKYEWKRHLHRRGPFQEFSYHLINARTSKLIAHITPEPLTAREVQEEDNFGGWVPPCIMHIVDKRAFQRLTDIAE